MVVSGSPLNFLACKCYMLFHPICVREVACACVLVRAFVPPMQACFCTTCILHDVVAAVADAEVPVCTTNDKVLCKQWYCWKPPPFGDSVRTHPIFAAFSKLQKSVAMNCVHLQL
jgi:hypothetical protein